MSEDRVSSGIDGLDSLIAGGFPKGSLILLAGNPGTGKTIFGMHFLCKGAKEYGEDGVYVSLAESEDTLFHNMSKLFGYDLKTMENGKVKILDFTTVTEKGLSIILEMVLEEVMALKAKSLVIDSFSAMAQAFREPIEARMILHNILGKMVRQLGCTTILVVEVPAGSEKIGVSIEEFVADGVFVLRKDNLEGRLIREIEIQKLRGTRFENQKFLFTLNNGFKVFPPFTHKEVKKPPKFEPTRGTKTHYPSGIPELDEILGGEGYLRGSSVLYELGENVPVEALDALINPTIANFISRKRGVIIIPPIGYSPDYIRRMIVPFTGEEEFDESVRVIDYPNPLVDQNKPHFLVWSDPSAAERRDPISYFNRYVQTVTEIASGLGKNLLHVQGVDHLTYITGKETYNPAVFGRGINMIRVAKDLQIYISKPGLPEMTKIYADVVGMHYKIEERNGSMILFGKKPKTTIYNIEEDTSRGCRVKLTPIV